VLCRYEKTIFQSKNGYCIFSYATTDQSVPEAARSKRNYRDSKVHFTAVGYGLPATETVEVNLMGTWQKSSYGLQLQVEHFEETLPTDTVGITAYLSSGCIKGVGPNIAKAIVARFGAKTMEVIEKDPDQLLTVKGIAKAKLEKIKSSYQETAKLRGLTQYLAPYGVSMKKIAKTYEEFGDQSLSVVRTDPFQLCKIRGFGFETVDTIARKTKVSLRNPLRYSGAIHHCLDENRHNGHLFIPYEELIDRCHELLNRDLERETVTKQDIVEAILNEHTGKKIYNERGRVYLTFDRHCEVYAARRVVTMLLDSDVPIIKNLQQEIKKAETSLKQILAASQRNAVETCLTNLLSIMTGGPGTGKTTTLRTILHIYHKVFPNHEILLIAPTGKASRRMSEQTGFPASTMHLAMGISNELDLEEDVPEFLSADFVVVDECSMADMSLLFALLMRLKSGAKLLLVGDPDQLPSVGPGNVLRELIRSGVVPTAVLDTVFRQASNSRIYLNAYAVNHGDTKLLYGSDFIMEDAKDGESAAEQIIKDYLAAISKYGIENVQILTPFKKRGAVSSINLNDTIRELVNPARAGVDQVECGGRTFRVGDRIIQTKNSKDVSNGEMGIIDAIRSNEDDELVIDVKLQDGRDITYELADLENVDYSYAITIHKSQGAEFPYVIIPLLKEHYIMLRRNLLYTAISRAKAQVMIVGQRQALYMAIHKSDVDKRNTILADRIVFYRDRILQKQAV